MPRKGRMVGRCDIATLITVIILIQAISACFITNCPPGGKRSVTKHIRQCARCGPGLKGRCYGPRICCDPRLGCYLGTEATLLPCLVESIQTAPCRNHGANCGQDAMCAAPGVCCSQNSCQVDTKCNENHDPWALLAEDQDYKVVHVN